MATDLTVIVPDRPGTVAAVAEALGEQRINISGGCGFSVGGEGILHLCFEGVDNARQVVEQAGFEVRHEREVLVTEIDDHPGALGALTRRIADAGANLDLMYLTADGRLVLGTDDIDRARQALQ